MECQSISFLQILEWEGGGSMWSQAKKSIVCSLHFKSEDFQADSRDKNLGGKSTKDKRINFSNAVWSLCCPFTLPKSSKLSQTGPAVFRVKCSPIQKASGTARVECPMEAFLTYEELLEKMTEQLPEGIQVFHQEESLVLQLLNFTWKELQWSPVSSTHCYNLSVRIVCHLMPRMPTLVQKYQSAVGTIWLVSLTLSLSLTLS